MIDSDIECHYCGHGMDASGSHEDDSGTWECYECEKEFEVEVEYDPNYFVKCSDLNHRWERVKTGFLICSNCDEMKRDNNQGGE